MVDKQFSFKNQKLLDDLKAIAARLEVSLSELLVASGLHTSIPNRLRNGENMTIFLFLDICNAWELDPKRYWGKE